MKSMKLTPEESKKSLLGCTAAEPGDGPAYPYGLELHLCDETLKKLGIEMPAVGSTMTLNARVVITSVGSSQQQDGDKEERASAQITDMELTPDAAKSSFYPNSSMS